MTTTAEIYAPPSPSPEPTHRRSAPHLMAAFTEGQRTAAQAWFDFATTVPPEMPPEVRARLLHELAELSVDPDSLDRDSEVDIWGFHDEA